MVFRNCKLNSDSKGRASLNPALPSQPRPPGHGSRVTCQTLRERRVLSLGSLSLVSRWMRAEEGEERGQEPLRLSGEVSAARAPVRLVRGHSTGARGLVQVECAGLGQWGQNARLGWRASPKGHILSSKVLLPFQAPDSAEARLGLLGELFC